MASILPPIPRAIFTIFEPISLVAGWIAPFINMSYFVNSQLPFLNPHTPLPTEELLALQLCNLYGLLALVGLAVLHTTTEARVVHGYLVALWIADIGHIAICAWGFGLERTLDVGEWDALAWGNIGVTTSLCVARTLYLLGAFGPDRDSRKNLKRGKTN
ncbi:hypothetical protein P152DRAFT_475130 [Eremomyces bilateralis CBS 781.70]|uniref:DUF7704 domain-containing protein n=1 Tax=Eremomyces bilateralis CBS 781.70 TaxID=1392243 RepID=A0A6G1FZD7_9PEZI|nr:uncharacterized protein P152DRAFT_475130 [Eremomyces bilateralis CBS 781.70]KAF1811082.1 hypothetical protein P152DRAFT_475130 [Eremomyces bilateralis CBS 781.70]